VQTPTSLWHLSEEEWIMGQWKHFEIHTYIHTFHISVSL